MCFNTPSSDFEAYHRSTGETCDYGSMKADMTSALTDGASESWFDLDVSWLDGPDIDLSSVFDFLDQPGIFNLSQIRLRLRIERVA